MENASKALLIAAGILIGLILITMILYGYGQISSDYKIKEESLKVEQLSEFNKQFIGYDRNDVRGSDLLSLVNKIVNFNTLNADEGQIELEINIGEIKNFYYNYDSNKRIKLLKSNYTHSNINADLVIPAMELESQYTQEIAKKLANNVSVLFITDESKIRNRKAFLEENNIEDTGKDLTEDILKYYQYIQFKRAHFDCEGLTYKDRKSEKNYI